MFNDALAKAAVTAVGSADVEGMRSSRKFIPRELLYLDERIKKTEETGSSKEVINIAKAFEEGLNQVVGGVKASVTKKYWGYSRIPDDELTDENTQKEISQLPSHLGTKKFLEFEVMKKKNPPVTLRFGDFMSTTRHSEVKKTIEAQSFGVVVNIATKNPACSVTGIRDEHTARAIGRIIGEANSKVEEGEEKK